VPLPDGPHISRTFQPSQSAGLFVGIRQFSKDESLVEVPYAVDDAVDLAHFFALEQRLLDPHRVSLALSGEPAKVESKARLKELAGAGATISGAQAADVYKLLDRQTRAAGSDGLLIVSFATHGLDDEGAEYLMAEDSLLAHLQRTAIPVREVFNAVSQTSAPRRIVFLDSCRERLRKARGAGADPRSASGQALVEAMAKAEGQIVLSAAPEGGYAYDDPERKNGVFTASVLQGLRCKAKTDDWGYVTAETLAEYVNDEVKTWVGKRSAGQARLSAKGIEKRMAGDGSSLPLVRCVDCAVAAQPDTVEVAAERVEAYSRKHALLWVRRVSGTIARARVVDLNGDGSPEVIVGVGSGGTDTGKVLAFDCKGDSFWTSTTTAPFNYDGGHSDRMSVVELAIADLFGSGRQQVVSLSIDSQAWFQSRLCIFDSDGGVLSSYWHPGHLHKVVIGSEQPEAPKRIIVAGVNNNLRAAFAGKGEVSVVFMLDPHNVQGEAPPYGGRSGPGTELWYGVILPRGPEIVLLDVLDHDDDGRNEIIAWTNKSHILYLGFDGKLIGGGGGDGAEGEIRYGLLKMSPPH
jgi:hypothetical protein